MEFKNQIKGKSSGLGEAQTSAIFQ